MKLVLSMLNLVFQKAELFNRKSSQKNWVFRELAFYGEKPGLSGEKVGLPEKNLVYLVVVIFFACHRRV